MAVGETATGEATVRAIETVPADVRIRHFDQLSHDEQAWLVETLDGGTARRPPTSFVDGEVVVFTDYLQLRTA